MQLVAPALLLPVLTLLLATVSSQQVLAQACVLAVCSPYALHCVKKLSPVVKPYCCLQANSSLPLRFWLDEYAFTPGETTLLKEEIEVCVTAACQCQL